MNKRWIFAAVAIACATIGLLSACSNGESKANDWGSFTADKTYSYDEKYYASQSVVEGKEARMVKVAVCRTNTDEVVAEFEPARASDFWGVCWEKDTYNIWVQSGDIGTLCYVYQNET